MKKLLTTLLIALLAICTLFAFAACGNSSPSDGDKEPPSIEETISNHEHKYDAREICTVCGYTENGTVGLEYDYSSENNNYCVIGIGTATETDIIIPSVYDDGEHGKLSVDSINVNETFQEKVRSYVGTGPNGFYYGEGAFENETQLTSVVIGFGVARISDEAFRGCSGLKRVVIPQSVISIEYGAFYDCSGLTCITIPKSVTSIGGSAFSGCSGLTSITIPKSITSIGGGTFSGCSGLTSISIPDSVTSIENSAFYGCNKIIQTENGVQYVDKWVIDCDENVTSVSLRSNTVGIANFAFGGCSGLTSITYEGTKAEWNAIEKGNSWNYDTGNYTVHCTDGDIAKEA